MTAPEVTVAVPVKDRREQMLRCLDALLAQDHPSFEILVCDNESSDGTPEAVRERAAGARVPIRVEVIAGTVGHVRNRAAGLARGEFLAFTDSDCLPEPGWLSAATAALQRDPSLGVVQGRTLPEVEPDDGWPATIQVEEFTGRYESCNVVFRREPFAASAGFDEQIGHFWEDAAAGFAMRRAGWQAAYVEDAVVRHDVTYPGYWWHVKRMQKNRNLAPVLARYPEMRRELFYGRIFLSPRSAKYVLLLAGLTLARRLPLLGLAMAVPYFHQITTHHVEGAQTREDLLDPKPFAQSLIYDGSKLAGLLRGGLRNGRIVL